MTNKSDGSLTPIASAQKPLCDQHSAAFVPTPPESKVGFALSAKGKFPINGLRHPVAGDANGWYIWCGQDFKDHAEFFAPLHVSHVYQEYPEIAKFLGLPPGYRFLFAPGYTDVWFDELLLKI